MKSFLPFLLVGCGGFVGSMLRYLMTRLFQDFHSIPFGTLISNLGGCFIIGIVTGLSVDIPVLSSESRLLLATGLCGGFTTLSSLIYELAQFFNEDEYLIGSFYLTGTLLGAALAFFIGTALVKLFIRG
ncbi:MAG TPA: CrcB family protein [Chitinispirillaceae bacterium]|nr:CrcB family protein [Chitinispirillaceae bacterium]